MVLSILCLYLSTHSTPTARTITTLVSQLSSHNNNSRLSTLLNSTLPKCLTFLLKTSSLSLLLPSHPSSHSHRLHLLHTLRSPPSAPTLVLLPSDEHQSSPAPAPAPAPTTATASSSSDLFTGASTPTTTSMTSTMSFFTKSNVK